MGVPAIVHAAGDAADRMIVALDQCATDMLEAVEKNYRYHLGEGLAQGRHN